MFCNTLPPFKEPNLANNFINLKMANQRFKNTCGIELADLKEQFSPNSRKLAVAKSLRPIYVINLCEEH